MPTEASVRHAEQKIRREAREWYLHRHSSGALEPLEFWAALQHFGVPTRMLEFSFNALVATWFAVENASHDNVDAAVFGVDVTKAIRPDHRTYGDVNEKAPWDVDDPGDLLQCWAPPPLEARMALQHSCFLYGNTPADPSLASIPLDFTEWRAERLFSAAPGSGRYPKTPVVVLRVPSRAKAGIRDTLDRVADLNHRTIFGDLAGFAETLRRRSRV